MNKIYRTDETFIDRGTLSSTDNTSGNWLNDVAEYLLLKETMKQSQASMEANAVEVSRKRNDQPSVYEMMSSLVSPQKPKFSSVDEVVADYQDRTGLSKHIKSKQNESIKSIAQSIIDDSNSANTPNPFRTNMDYTEKSDANDGGNSGKISDKDLEELSKILYPHHGQKPVSEIAQIHRQTHPHEFERILTEKSNADDGQKEADIPQIEQLKNHKKQNEEKRKTLEEKIHSKEQEGIDLLQKLQDGKKEVLQFKSEMEQIDDVNAVFDGAIEKIKKKKSKKKSTAQINDDLENTKKPQILEENPGIYNFISNTIETNHGIQIPVLIHNILSTFSRDGISKDQVMDPEFLRFINKMIIDRSSSEKHTPSNIGKNLGTSTDNFGKDSNKDPFMLLTPAK
jgi:hypothetical protein